MKKEYNMDTMDFPTAHRLRHKNENNRGTSYHPDPVTADDSLKEKMPRNFDRIWCDELQGFANSYFLT